MDCRQYKSVVSWDDSSLIDVKDGKWTMGSEVIGFQAVSGEHSGWNLGQYFVGLCDRVGICNDKESKVCYLMGSMMIR